MNAKANGFAIEGIIQIKRLRHAFTRNLKRFLMPFLTPDLTP